MRGMTDCRFENHEPGLLLMSWLVRYQLYGHQDKEGQDELSNLPHCSCSGFLWFSIATERPCAFMSDA